MALRDRVAWAVPGFTESVPGPIDGLRPPMAICRLRIGSMLRPPATGRNPNRFQGRLGDSEAGSGSGRLGRGHDALLGPAVSAKIPFRFAQNNEGGPENASSREGYLKK